jgi:hypothetical protein
VEDVANRCNRSTSNVTRNVLTLAYNRDHQVRSTNLRSEVRTNEVTHHVNEPGSTTGTSRSQLEDVANRCNRSISNVTRDVLTLAYNRDHQVRSTNLRIEVRTKEVTHHVNEPVQQPVPPGA